MNWYVTWQISDIKGSYRVEDFSSKELAKERIKELLQLYGSHYLSYTLIYGSLEEDN